LPWAAALLAADGRLHRRPAVRPGAGGPATTAAAPATTAAPATAEAAPEATRPAPKGLIAVAHRKAAPPLRVTDSAGRTHDLAELRGRPVVVNFFESWCVVCRTEQNDVDDVAEAFQGRVQFLGVSNHDTVSEGPQVPAAFRGPLPAGQRLERPHLGRLGRALPAGHRGRRPARPVAWRFAGLLEPGMLDPVLEYLVEV
jgi:thiol-disulfide isomerase/thioredoxin